MSLAVLVARIPDHLSGEREELVPSGQHGRYQPTDLRCCLVH
jgi:hypothetical protein